MTVEKPDVFLCHNAADKDWVRELGTRLEAESIDGTPDGRRIRVFFDEWDIERGENIVARLGRELASGAFVAVVMSPEFFASEWTRFEWTDVVARDPANKGGRLLPPEPQDHAASRPRGPYLQVWRSQHFQSLGIRGHPELPAVDKSVGVPRTFS